MKFDLVESNVVVVAHHFNPSILNQLWLVKHGLIAEDDFLPGSIFSDVVSQAQTEKFVLVLTPVQLQLTPKIPAGDAGKLILDLVSIFAKTLPHTPFRAMGVNFTWHVEPPQGSEKFSRELCFNDRQPLFRELDSPDAKFGAYISTDRFGVRLKLDIKPVVDTRDNRQMMQFKFNYHADLQGDTDDAVGTIISTAAKWDETLRGSEDLLRTAGVLDANT